MDATRENKPKQNFQLIGVTLVKYLVSSKQYIIIEISIRMNNLTTTKKQCFKIDGVFYYLKYNLIMTDGVCFFLKLRCMKYGWHFPYNKVFLAL